VFFNFKLEEKPMSKGKDAAIAELAEALTSHIKSYVNGPAVDMEKHQARLAALHEKQEKMRPVLEACLDPAVAARYELEKPRYKFKVSMTPKALPSQQSLVDVFDDDDAEAEELPAPKPITLTVVAQNEDDAWARFCDSIGQWPGRRFARPTIVKGKQVSLAKVAADQASGPYKSGHVGG
jgi:hypothetical protein